MSWTYGNYIFGQFANFQLIESHNFGCYVFEFLALLSEASGNPVFSESDYYIKNQLPDKALEYYVRTMNTIKAIDGEGEVTHIQKKIAQIKKLRPLHKNAIQLTKYALDKAKQKTIAGYEVELACLTFNFNNLSDCVYHLINYFSGRIKQNCSTVDKVLQKQK